MSGINGGEKHERYFLVVKGCMVFVEVKEASGVCERRGCAEYLTGEGGKGDELFSSLQCLFAVWVADSTSVKQASVIYWGLC